MENMPVYILKNISQGYNHSFFLSVPELIIERGSSTGFTGPNGSGKSTLFRLLALLEEPQQGSIVYSGCQDQDKTARGEVTMLQQDPYLLRRTVFENVAYGLRARRERGIKKKVFDALKSVGLSPYEFARRSPRALSGGEAQRVALASRLVLSPKVLILDEPTSSIDRGSARLIREAIIDIRDRHNTTLIISSHDHIWLNQIADKIFRMNDGRIIGSGSGNLIEGPWLRDADDLWSRTLPGGDKVFATEPPHENSAALLNPSDIIISVERPVRLSAQNCLGGVISSMSRSGESGKIRVDVDIHGLILSCNLTLHAVNDLKLVPGMPVFLIFKASSLEWN